MSERQQRDVGKAGRPEGLCLRGRHAALRALAIEWLWHGGARLACQPRKHNATRAEYCEQALPVLAMTVVANSSDLL